MSGRRFFKRRMLSLCLLLILGGSAALHAQTLEHFTPVENTGDTRPVYVLAADINGTPLAEGDEIAVYDDTLCVGAFKMGSLPEAFSSILQVVVLGDTLPGAIIGNPIKFKLWQKSGNREVDATPTFTIATVDSATKAILAICMVAAAVSAYARCKCTRTVQGIACVSSTWVEVITGDGLGDASCCRVAGVGCAQVPVITQYSSVDTGSGHGVAGIIGTNVHVVAINQKGDTGTVCWITDVLGARIAVITGDG